MINIIINDKNDNELNIIPMRNNIFNVCWSYEIETMFDVLSFV